jgi:hypothetical protein
MIDFETENKLTLNTASRYTLHNVFSKEHKYDEERN